LSYRGAPGGLPAGRRVQC